MSTKQQVRNKKQKPKRQPQVAARRPTQAELTAMLAGLDGGQLQDLPAHSATQPLRQAVVLRMQRQKGNAHINRVMRRRTRKNGGGRRTLPAPETISHEAAGARPVIRRRNGAGGDGELPAKAPDAAGLVAAQYPLLKLPADQISILQKVLDARLAIKKGEKRLKKYPIYEGPHGWGGLSKNVRKREQIEKGLGPHHDHLRRHRALYVPTDVLLGNDILSRSKEDSPAEIAFRDSLYKTLIAHQTRLDIGSGLNPDPLFPAYLWGPNKWRLGHKDGLVMFDNLMAVQKWNLAWQKVLLGEQVELLEEMEKLSRAIGGKPVDATGKKLGETYGHFWNTTIKVGIEIGPSGGYYDDPEGRAELNSAYLAARGARAVIRGPDNWLHIFALDPFNAYDMKGAIGDDYVYLLTTGAQVSAERVTTADGFELSPGSGKTGSGWRMEKILGEAEQFAIGAFFGDFMEDPGVTMSVGQIVVGCVPIVGQIADARDVAAGIYKMWQTGGKDGKLQTALALVGFIPLFGDGIKAAKKAFAKGGREAAKEAFARTIKEGVPEATETLAKQIIKDPDNVAKALNISKKELSELSELAEQVAKGGTEAAEKYAAKMSEHFDAVGGNAAAVVAIGGGSWKSVAQALAASPAGEALGKKMHAWRVAQFDAVSQKMKQKAGDFGQDIDQVGAPQMVRTGSESFLSDVDVSFLGPNATVHRNAAIRQMEAQYGSGWRKLLDADIFADPKRLHMFEEPLAEVGGKAAREAEKRIVSESEINVLAKMLQTGANPAQVAKTARELGVDMAAVGARKKEIAELAADNLANMLRRGTPESEVAKMASEMGLTVEAVEAQLKSGADVYRQLELKMDVLHKRFLDAAGDPAEQAKIAEEMAAVQGKLNAATPGPYMTPGGGAKHVTAREMKLRPKGAHKALSPALGYTALLDDYYMLQHALQGVGARFTEGQAKNMTKYADRLLITAGQFGVDMSKKSTGGLWQDVALMLQRARLEKRKPDLKKIQGKLDWAKRSLQGQLDELAKAVQKNADDYLAEAAPAAKASAADRRSVRQMLTRSEQVIAKQIALILRIQLRDAEPEKGEGQAGTP